MKLNEVLKNIEIKNSKNMKNVEITNISSDSRVIKENGLFFAINGYNKDGIEYIESAISNGAVAIIVEGSVNLDI